MILLGSRKRGGLGLLSFLALALFARTASAGPTKTGCDEPWKVEASHGPSKTVSFTTDEGTWLSLDVHPDGRRIVFSLLGDLYLLPVEGGEAKRITTGPAYNVQPRFSPDGKWIAFASDRGGTENLWICDLEGKNARPVSREKDVTVSSPAWSPDGQYLVGRKRLTDVSSLGAVELWIWHVLGGKGIRLTKKDAQPDAADPAFSPDGRFLYFSARDARYAYNRNVNEGIWQVKRLDRRTGKAVRLTGHFGGAAAPTPSRDGRFLAYVRRARAKTRIEVADLVTGGVRLVAEDVTRDNQEGFAFHGVFPGFAWAPDGRSIVATAAGKIWRWDVASGVRTPIPFTAAVEQRVTNAVRFPQALGGDSLRARILRWPVESPAGKRLVFSAAGHLYGMDLPSGTPRRLTTLSELEYAPTFSPDGSRIAFVTWSDEKRGHLWTVPFPTTGAAAPKRLTDAPGQYANPAFSADGQRVVYLKAGGITLGDADLSHEPIFDIIWVSAEGGPSRYVVSTPSRGSNRRMPRPQFSRDGARIFFVEDEKQKKPFLVPKTGLVSVQLDGADRQVHLRWARAEEAVVSPDGRWVAFSELHNVYVTPLPELGGRTVEIDLKKPPLPLGQLTDDGGEWVAWADGGRTVTWISGPLYHRLALDRAFPDEEPPAGPAADPCAKKKKKLPTPESAEIALTLPRPRPSETVAYRGARIVTLRGAEVIERGTLVVAGDRIRAVGPEEAVLVPEGARVMDLAGRTLIPGLIDEHAHMHFSSLDIFPERPWRYLANLAYGVTTAHDPSASTHEVFAQAEMVEAGLMVGPRIFSTGFVLYGADDPGRAFVKGLEDARKHLRRLKRLGAFTVKSYMQPRREQRQWILQAAREEQMMVVPEGGGDLEMDMTMVLDGHTTVEHALPVTPLYRDVAVLFGRSGTAYTPTLLVAYGGLAGEKWFYQHHDVWKDERLQRYVPQAPIDRVARIRTMATDEDWHHNHVAAGAKKIVEAGGRVCLGAHGQMQGLGPHWEMWAMVQGGMTPLEALRAGTRAPAEALGLDRDLGSLEAGKLADFVVLAKNPLEKIENSDSVVLVVKNGVAYRPEDLVRRAAPR
jgi:Tol biopolymer transport system component/imidazolonepropionase-like amidohydrolase